MEDLKRYFEPVLDEDEQILAVFKPNKKKLYISTIIAPICIALFMGLFALVPIISTGANPLYLLIPAGVVVLVLIITLILLPIYYNNLYYAYTDKRLITRTGIVGIDYRFLIMDSIGAVNVYVSWIDKLVGNTGTLIFGSMSAPLMQTDNGTGSGYRFAHIDMPYEQYKKIRVLIQKERENGITHQ